MFSERCLNGSINSLCPNMNKNIITSYLMAGFFFSFVFASSTSAFWPFDTLFKKSGDVKAETTEKKYVGDVMPGGSRAYMTYQTLVTMNDACRKMFSQTYPTPTRAKITPSTKERVADSRMAPQKETTESINKMYEMEFGIEKKSETELNSIYNNLKARCDNIANLTTRMQKIYKGNNRPSPIKTDDGGSTRPTIIKYSDDGMERPSVTPTKRPIINFNIRDDSEEKRVQQ